MGQSTVSPLGALARHRAPFASDWTESLPLTPSPVYPLASDPGELTDEMETESPLRALARNRRLPAPQNPNDVS